MSCLIEEKIKMLEIRSSGTKYFLIVQNRGLPKFLLREP
jgi:hypothetical protein